jgi:enoyl-CoA hydratase/carnithine racemase
MEDVVKRKISKDGVLTVTLNRPESLNSLNYELVMGVISAFDEASSNDDIRSVILTGEGKRFLFWSGLNWRWMAW